MYNTIYIYGYVGTFIWIIHSYVVIVPVMIALGLDYAAEFLKWREITIIYNAICVLLFAYAPAARIFPYVRTVHNGRCTMRMY